MTGAGITPEVLPPSLRRHADPAAQAPLRTMGARLLVPASPQDALCLLYLLSFDPEEAIRLQAEETAAALPEKVALAGLRDEGVPGPVLGWLVAKVRHDESRLELLALNPSTPDDALAQVAGGCTPKVGEILAQNQLRLLRSEPFLRSLLGNPDLPASVRDGVADFAFRSGIYLEDVGPLVEAKRRIVGDDPLPPPGPTADELLQEMHRELRDEREGGEELPEERKLTLTQRLIQMSVAEKIKLATLGNKEARTLLLRDTNKLVCLAAVQSPRITEAEIIALSLTRTTQEEIIRTISNNREWMKLYPVKVNLTKNPKTPVATALRLIPHLRERELKELQSSKGVPHVVQTTARGLLMKKKR